MVKVSNHLLGILNFISLLISIPIIIWGLWLSNQSSSDCGHFLDTPVTLFGFSLLLFSLLGLIGACNRSCYCPLYVYLVGLLVLIVVLLAFTVFAFVVTNKGAGEVISGRGYKEYRLGDYSHWLQKKVGKNWGSIRSCLEDSKICQKLMDDDDNNTVAHNFYKLHLSALQSGCCKPSNDCNFTYVNPTNWIKSTVQPVQPTTATEPLPIQPNNTDCDTWSNDPKTLCYSCESCKAGLIDSIKSDWKRVAKLNIIFLVFLFVVFLLGVCAFHNRKGIC